MWDLENKTNAQKKKKKNRNRLTDRNKLVVVRGEGVEG